MVSHSNQSCSLGVTQQSLIEQALQSGKGQIVPSVRLPLSNRWAIFLPAPSFGMKLRWWIRAGLADGEHWPGV